MKAKLLCFSLLFASVAQAADPYCVNSCLSGGKSYAMCTNECNFRDRNNAPQIPELQQPVRIDQGCMRNCTTSGSGYQFCRSRCSY